MITERRTVYIRWVDSYGCTARWEELHNDYPVLTIETVGFVVHNDDNTIAVANSIAGETPNTPNQSNGVMTIPKICIVELKYLIDE